MAIDKADTLWVLLSSAAIFLMAPGCGYFYSGTVEFKNALSLILFAFLIYCLVSIQWYLFGFSLSFSPSSQNNFIGDFDLGAINRYFDMNATHPAASTVPGMAFMVFQGTFAAVTPTVAYAAAAERLRLFPFFIFVIIWSTVVYDPICYWVFSPNGWMFKLGVQDYAGGLVVHTVAGMTGLALALGVGRRKNPHATPHSLPFVALGTVLLWFGWLFFNAGSALAINARAALAFVNTNVAACAGGLTWLFFDYRIHHKFTTLGFCSGLVAGLACITPGSGFTLPHYALIYGAVGAILANMACFLKGSLGYDDTLDTFPVHAVAGMVGTLLNGIFSTRTAISLDGNPNIGGFIDGHYVQLGYQVVGVVVVALWSFVITFFLVKLFSFIPSLNLRVSDEEESMGCDITLCGEVAYDYTNSSMGPAEYEQTKA